MIVWDAELPDASKAVIEMILYPPSRSISAVKFPEASAVTICSRLSEIMLIIASGADLPEMVTESLFKRDSSSGEVMVREIADEEGGVGERVSAVVGKGEPVGAGVAWGAAAFFRLLLAVQMPKVMTKPRVKPMAIAKRTSFFMSWP